MRVELPVITTHVRPLDVHRDLLAVADLIELCFASTLDPDGREYLRHIRKAATDPTYLRWTPGASERVSMPLYGYVWEENRRIVGNLSLIPIFKGGQWMYLIANVSVHPDYRQRGIARALTLRALEHIREHHVQRAWLQVRDDNMPAFNLYQTVGFVERSRRTTWMSSGPILPNTRPDIGVTPRWKKEWRQQIEWLGSTYPLDVTWNLSFDPNRFNPNTWRGLIRWLNGETQLNWAARRNEPNSNGLARAIGFASWEPLHSYSDLVWVATSPQNEQAALSALLPAVRQALRDRHRPISVNYPQGRAVESFQAAGFIPQNTLIWMEYQKQADSITSLTGEPK